MSDSIPEDSPPSTLLEPPPALQNSLQAGRRSGDYSDTAYALLREQTLGSAGTANQAGRLAALVFLVVAVIIIVAVSQGADLRQLLIAAIVLALINGIAAVVWAARTASRR